MAEVARTYSFHMDDLTDVELNMDRWFQLAVHSPANLPLLREVGPIMKFHLRINRSYRQFMDFHGVTLTQTTPPTTVLNHRTQFPAALAWSYLGELFSSVETLIPPECFHDTMSRIFAYAVQSSANPIAAVVHLTAEITVLHPVLARRDSFQVVDSTLIVDEPPPYRRGDWFSRAVDPVMIVDDEPEVTPVDVPRRPSRRSARDLKERYLISAAEVDEKLGDCAVCLEELKIVAGRSSRSEVLKMPCSHLFHHKCIYKWLKRSDTCPMCRAVIP